MSNTLALGVKPIGSVTSYEKDKFPTYLKAKTRGIKLLGIHYQPNLERILLLKPDLIVGWDRERAIYPLLSTIAPTILGKWQGFPSWREYFNFIAKALGKKEAAQQAWNHYYQRIKELQISLGEGYQNKKISFIYFCCHGIGSDVKNSFIGSILNDAGLQRPEAQDVITFPYGTMNVSEEELDKADGDILFVAAFTEDDKSYLKKLEQKPLWKKLKAVQQNHVYFVNGDAWRGGNLIAANFVIDDLFKYLVNTP
ncbi:iron-siderophore ABC transporter substrate-binding protein [Scytonema sp. NUACC21]